jgi:hypothetical protein
VQKILKRDENKFLLKGSIAGLPSGLFKGQIIPLPLFQNCLPEKKWFG